MQTTRILIGAILLLAGARANAGDEVIISEGAFFMGSDRGAEDERPPHEVQLSTFAIDRHEVTNARYQRCVKAGQCKAPILRNSHHRERYYDDPAFAEHPVIFVNWEQADTFCRFAGGRLPSEAEWEKAARGPSPDRREYPWGDTPPDCSRANFKGCVDDTDRVGSRPAGAGPYGLLDQAGNVWEWVADWYDAEYYRTSPDADPAGPKRGTLKVMRGGCWVSGADSLRVSCRKGQLPEAWADNVGFRCAYPVEGGAR